MARKPKPKQVKPRDYDARGSTQPRRCGLCGQEFPDVDLLREHFYNSVEHRDRIPLAADTTAKRFKRWGLIPRPKP
jgi:hypothetical protein